MTVDNIAIKVTETGSRDVAASLRDLSRAVNDNAGAVDELGRVTAGHAETHEAFRFHARESKMLVGELTRSFQGLTPEIGLYSEMLRTGIGVMHGFTELLGGPMSIAIGVTATALTAFGIAMSEDAKETKKLADEQKKLNAELAKEATFDAQLAKADKADASKKKWDSLANLTAGQKEYTAAIEAFRLKAELASKQGNEIDEREYNYKRVHYERLRELAAEHQHDTKANQLEFEGATMEADASAAELAAAKHVGAQIGKTKAQAEADAREEANKSAIANVDKLLSENKRDVGSSQREQDSLRANLAARNKLEADFANENQRTLDVINGKEALSEATKTKNFQKEQVERHKTTVLLQQQLTQLGESGAQAMTKGLSELAKGHKVAIGQIVESLGDQLVATGTITEFQGLSRALSSYGMDPTSEAMIALGAVEIGAGVTMGAAGANNGGSNSKAGGGGGGGPVAASPVRDTASNAPPSAPNIVNINMPTTVSPSPEDGRRVGLALAAFGRVYGKQHINTIGLKVA